MTDVSVSLIKPEALDEKKESKKIKDNKQDSWFIKQFVLAVINWFE